jgi:hypothetical protein
LHGSHSHISTASHPSPVSVSGPKSGGGEHESKGKEKEKEKEKSVSEKGGGGGRSGGMKEQGYLLLRGGGVDLGLGDMMMASRDDEGLSRRGGAGSPKPLILP